MGRTYKPLTDRLGFEVQRREALRVWALLNGYPSVPHRGRLHNLTWEFGAVPLDAATILAPRSAALGRGTDSLVRLVSRLAQIPGSCHPDLLLWVNRTLCREVPLAPSWLSVICRVVRAGTSSGATDSVCAGLAAVSSRLRQGLSIFLEGCASRSSRSGVQPPSRSRRDRAPSGGHPGQSPSRDQPPSRSRRDQPRRRGRQLPAGICHYDSAFFNSTQVGYCSVLDEAGFRETFCGNASLLEPLMENPANSWLGAFCAASPTTEGPRASPSPAYSVAAHCLYRDWAPAAPTDPRLLSFCASEDSELFSIAVCGDEHLLRQNPWLLEYCEDLALANSPSGACEYSQWEQHRPDPSIIALCRSSDTARFNATVCASGNLLHALGQDASNAWLDSACATPGRCRYWEWIAGPLVPASQVSFCADLEPSNFDLMVCTSAALLERLLQDPGNAWLYQACAVPQLTSPAPGVGAQVSSSSPWDLIDSMTDLCHYDSWLRPAAVDSTVVALCFNNDGQQFNARVCQDPAILQQLLQDQNNLWLVDLCGLPSFEEVNGSVPSAACRYIEWAEVTVDPYLVDFCWTHDQTNFSRLVCRDQAMVSKLLLYPENAWLLSACHVEGSANTSCRYEEWADAFVDSATVEFCSQYDLDNFVQVACDNSTRLWELLDNREDGWLAAYCAHAQGDGMDLGLMCTYSSWSERRVDPTTLALCFDHDQSNFNQFVCLDPALLHVLTSDPDNSWVEQDCLSLSLPTDPSQTDVCPVHQLISKLQWTCSRGPWGPCPHQVLQLTDVPALVLCGLEHIGLKMHSTAADELTTGLTGAMNNVILGLVVLDDERISFLQQARSQVLYTLLDYLGQEHSYNTKREVLQCFGSVILDLVQKDRGTSGVSLAKEYMKLSAADLRVALLAIDVQKVKHLLYLLNTNWHSLQIQNDLKRILASVFLHRILLIDPSMFPEFVYFLPHLSTSEIQALPETLDKEQVLAAVNQIFGELSDDQRRAFVQWILNSGRYSNVTTWPLRFLHHVGNLLVYLPFERFQLLSRTQILTALDALLATKLTTVQERFLIRTILKGDKTIGTSDFERLGRLICSSASRDLEPYKQNLQMFAIVKEQLLNCIGDQIFVPNELLSDFLIRTSSIMNQGPLVTNELSSLAHLLPILGLSFIKQLHPAHIQATLPELSAVNLSSAQARAIIDKMLQNVSITEELLTSLGSTVVGLSPAILRVIPSPLLVHILPDMAAYERILSPVQKLVAVNTLWESDNINALKNLDSLTKDIPLISLKSKVKMLLSSANETAQMKWSVQQAQMLFGAVLEANNYNMTEDMLSSLGFVARGLDCATLKHLMMLNTFLKLLRFFRDLPVDMPTSLRRCVLEALNSFVLTVEVMQNMQPQLLLDLQLLKIRRFSIRMTHQLLQVIVKNPIPFLKLPSSKQSLMIDWIVQVLNLNGRRFSKAEFDLLGFVIAFIADEVFMEIPRTEIEGNLLKMKDYCFDRQKKLLLGIMLTEDIMFGDPTNWTSVILDKVDRLVFFLSVEDLQKLPKILS
ncbi:uncharacterized protein strc1 isoform X2 [Narcine bancroftii]|uniref:uncharacterized protein strc1 isoform X2 n=1 Tax=Narcine bancroftii TaxID=1343680 RepID=UPI003831A7E9